MSRPLNLAGRPFRNETLPALLFTLGAGTLIGFTLLHGVTLARLRPGADTPREREVLALETRVAQLRAELAALRVPEPRAEASAQWALLKDLVDRRALRWTELLSVLEDALPAGVRVVSLVPALEKGQFVLELTIVARSVEEGLDLLRILEERSEFDQVYPLSVATREGANECRYSMRYRPPSQMRPAAAASGRPTGAAPGAGG